MTNKRTLLSLCSEEEFLEHVIGYARLRHWRVAHFRPARTGKGWRTAVSADGKGFPDLVMVRPPRLVFAELKSAKGQLTPEQRVWGANLLLIGKAEVYLWFPDDWNEICKLLD